MKRICLQGSLTLLMVLSGALALPRPTSASHNGSRAREPGSQARPVAQTRWFSLYSDPWINLHHFLYQWAVAIEHEGGTGTRVPVVEVPERAELSQLADAERRTWLDAVGYYRREIIPRNLVLDDELVAAKERLAQAVATDRASLAGLPQEWRETLEAAMPIYEKHWWSRHDARNRAWIRSLTPKLETYEEPLAVALVRAYGGSLPADRVRLDAAAYSHWSGAYTTSKPNDTVVATSDPAFQGFDALEIVMHEFSHVDELELAVRDIVARAFTREQAKPPHSFWHAVIFYTACDLTREALRAHGTEDFRCVAERVGLLRRNPSWQLYWQSLDAHWKPFLAGHGDREAAMDEVARDLLHAVPEGVTSRPSGRG